MLLISHPPCPLPQEGGEVRAATLDLLGASPLNPVRDCCVGLTGAAAPVKQGGLRSTAHSRYARKHKDSHTNPLCKDACSQPHKAVMQGCIKTATQSRCTMQRHKWLSLHDATAQMAVIAQMQRHKWLSMHRRNDTNG